MNEYMDGYINGVDTPSLYVIRSGNVLYIHTACMCLGAVIRTSHVAACRFMSLAGLHELFDLTVVKSLFIVYSVIKSILLARPAVYIRCTGGLRGPTHMHAVLAK